jgi:hypothetical protein
MSHTEIGSWILSGIAFVGVIWNRLNIKALALTVDGLLLKYVRGEKASSYSKGQANDQTGEAEDRKNLKP